MAHDFVAEELQLESQTGRISLQIIATLLGGMLLVCSVAARVIYDTGADDPFYSMTLAFVAAILLGTPLVVVAIKDLAHGHMHMNELVALAVVAAFAIGKYQEAAAIAFFMIISVLIENRTALGAQASIESLVKITPTKAHRIKRAAGQGPDAQPGETAKGSEAAKGSPEEEIDPRYLNPGDVVRVRPGDNIPADGRVIRGGSTVNEATITGESLPADKTEGDDVFSGTINLTGVMDIEVTKAGADTTLGQVKDLILQAERTRIPIMRMIDRYAGWYTPTALMIVGIVLFLTLKGGFKDPWGRAVSMLVIACPCALILATPTAMVAALSAAARLGVFIKSVVHLESARNLTAIIFDKTGTLTTGQLQVTRLAPASGVQGAELLGAAASAEQASKHPVARAVADVARRAKLRLPQPDQFHEHSGLGVSAVVDGHKVMVGRATWLTDLDATQISAEAVAAIREAVASPDAEGLSTLFAIRDGRLLGWIGLEDNARPQAAAAIDRLRTLGIKRLIIVTGDRQSVAHRIAGQLHTEYRAEVLPHEKLQILDELKAAGHRVLVVGDGVNDAPALAAGDSSIAMGAAGSDVAIHSANIALMNNNLNRIPFLIALSRRTSRVIRQNLIFGGCFILFFGGLAAAGQISAIWAAVLHVASSLVVVFNSARLVRAGEDIEHAEHQAGQRPENQHPAAPAPTAPVGAMAPA